MAEFIDGDGAKRTLRVRNIGHLEDVQEKHGVALDSVFMSDVQGVAELLWGNLRRLVSLIADLCGLDGDEAKRFARSFDGDALERAREALLEALADFCLPPHARGNFKAKIPQMLAMNTSLLGGSNKDTALPDSSAA